MTTAALQSSRELVELWSAVAADRLRAEQAKPGTLSGTELNRLGELLISAATWLKDDAENTRKQNRAARLHALKLSPAYAAMNLAQQIDAMARV